MSTVNDPNDPSSSLMPRSPDSGYVRSNATPSESPPSLMMGDSEAGPDVGEDLDCDEEQFRSASEVFKDPNAFDFLSQHGAGGQASQLARESLYVKFDPLIGRPSMAGNVDPTRQARISAANHTLTTEQQHANTG